MARLDNHLDWAAQYNWLWESSWEYRGNHRWEDRPAVNRYDREYSDNREDIGNNREEVGDNHDDVGDNRENVAMRHNRAGDGGNRVEAVAPDNRECSTAELPPMDDEREPIAEAPIAASLPAIAETATEGGAPIVDAPAANPAVPGQSCAIIAAAQQRKSSRSPRLVNRAPGMPQFAPPITVELSNWRLNCQRTRRQSLTGQSRWGSDIFCYFGNQSLPIRSALIHGQLA